VSAKIIVKIIAIIKIVNPIDRGFMAKINLVDAIKDTDRSESNIIYNYEACTHSLSVKG